MRKKDLSPRLLEVYSTVGKNVESLRGKMFKEILGQKAGLSRQTISAIEKGHGVNLKTLIKVADALGVELADLFVTKADEEELRVSYKHVLLMRKLKESLTVNKP